MDFLVRAFEGLDPAGAIADFGCGHGRHAAPLAKRLARPVIGVELDPYSLERRLPGFPAVLADFFALPVRTGALAAAYAWYASLASFPDEREPVLFAELARVLAPGGLLIFQTVPYERVAAMPESDFETTLPDGSRLSDRARFDPRTGRDECFRRLVTPEGRELSAHFFLRYHPLPEIVALLEDAGLTLAATQGDLDGGPVTTESTDLIVLARRDQAGT